MTRKEKIRIADADKGFAKKIEVEARIYGPLAVHQLGKDERWRVTHVATGGLVAMAKNLTAARAIAKGLRGCDWWKVKGPESKDALKAIAPIRAEVLEKYA